MNRFNYFIATALLSASIVFLSGCKNRESPRVAGPVNVEVDVVGSDSNSGGSADGNFSGTVMSGEEALVSFSVPGTITSIQVKEGQKVTKGQLLAKVKSESLVEERNIAAAELEQVRDVYTRLKKLHDQNALPDVKWVEVQSKLKQAENAVSLADRAVSDAYLTSPISGYISEKLADEGQSVLPAQPVLKIVNIGDLQIAIYVPEEEINRYDKNTSAEISFDALDGLTVSGQLAAKDIVADPMTRSYKVKFNIPDADGKILPGMIGKVKVAGLDSAKVDRRSDIFVVPSQAVLLSADNRQFVWVVKNGKAARKFVATGKLRTEGVAVDSGLVSGDSLIVAGMQKVSEGTHVAPIIK